jgi:acyl-CoA thioesterase FadM
MENPSVPQSVEMKFRYTVRTRWSDEDNQGVLNNAVYLTLFEEARHRWATERGLLDGNQFPFVLAHCNVLFTSPGRGGTDVIVEMSTTHIGNSSFTQAYRVTDARSGGVWCEAEARLVAWDNANQRKGILSGEFRARMG